MILSVAIAWGLVGLGGGILWSHESYTVGSAIKRIASGIILGPLVFFAVIA